MQQMSYADGIVFGELCCCLKQYIYDKKDKNSVSNRIEDFIKVIESNANGYWGISNRKRVFLEALKAIQTLLRYNITIDDISAIYKEYTEIILSIDSKCRVTFLVQDYSVWSSLREVYVHMTKDSRFETKIVYIPFKHSNQSNGDMSFDLYRKEGLPILRHSEYSIRDDDPDMVFFSKPYNLVPKEFYISEVAKVVDKTVYIPYGMECNYKLVLYGFQDYLHYKVWRHIVHNEYVKVVGEKFGYRNGENIVVWGHPKMDYFVKHNRVNIPKDWKEKIAGKKVMCWCPHHTILPGKEQLSTWVNYQETIFNWFENNRDVVLLWRPHPLLFGALVNNKYMTQDQIDAFLNEKLNGENIILDVNEDYHIAFECSDAMITDGTTFSVEYLGTGKPLMLTTNDITSYYNYEEAEKGLYIGNSKESVIEFFENVRNCCDPKKEARHAYAQKTIFYPEDKTISEYIAENLLKDLRDTQKNLARSLCE